jgi:hypothetical protein
LSIFVKISVDRPSQRGRPRPGGIGSVWFIWLTRNDTWSDRCWHLWWIGCQANCWQSRNDSLECLPAENRSFRPYRPKFHGCSEFWGSSARKLATISPFLKVGIRPNGCNCREKHILYHVLRRKEGCRESRGRADIPPIASVFLDGKS